MVISDVLLSDIEQSDNSTSLMTKEAPEAVDARMHIRHISIKKNINKCWNLIKHKPGFSDDRFKYFRKLLNMFLGYCKRRFSPITDENLDDVFDEFE